MLRAAGRATSRYLRSCVWAPSVHLVHHFSDETTMLYRTINVSAADAAGTITICRPKALNAVNTLVGQDAAASSYMSQAARELSPPETAGVMLRTMLTSSAALM